MRSDFAKIKNQSILKKLLKAAFFGNLVTLLFLAACAMLLWKGDIPESISKDLILGAAFAGSIPAGIVASAGEGNGSIPGVLGGLSYLVVVAVIGLYREQ
ncbi:MAG: TIGR04086 family membrane protein, partial [Oscillospiraceae bacterium]